MQNTPLRLQAKVLSSTALKNTINTTLRPFLKIETQTNKQPVPPKSEIEENNTAEYGQQHRNNRVHFGRLLTAKYGALVPTQRRVLKAKYGA